jgi:hypothetical protein
MKLFSLDIYNQVSIIESYETKHKCQMPSEKCFHKYIRYLLSTKSYINEGTNLNVVSKSILEDTLREYLKELYRREKNISNKIRYFIRYKLTNIPMDISNIILDFIGNSEKIYYKHLPKNINVVFKHLNYNDYDGNIQSYTECSVMQCYIDNIFIVNCLEYDREYRILKHARIQ